VPEVIHRINKALQRADQVQSLNGDMRFDMWAPIVADAEAGFGGALNAYELMLQMIEQGVAGANVAVEIRQGRDACEIAGLVVGHERQPQPQLRETHGGGLHIHAIERFGEHRPAY